MLNPDGVRHGFYRYNLTGADLNRRWDKPSRILHPTIFWAKRIIETSNEQKGVIMFCDLHGHS
jgi:murein tripeptide amidase MpaA